jgi:putative hemolysin
MRSLLKYLDGRDLWSLSASVVPTEKYFDRSLFTSPPADLPEVQLRRMLPPLIRSYIQAGAKFYGAPAWDEEFQCFDLFTVLDVEQLDDRFRSRFFDRPRLSLAVTVGEV